MTSSLHTRIIQAAAVAATLSALGLVGLQLVAPATAQRSLTYDDFGDDDDDSACMTPHRLRTFVESKGFSNVKINVPQNPWYVHATRGGVAYQLVVDTCRASIIGSRRVGTT